MNVEIRIVTVSKTDDRNAGILAVNLDTAAPLEAITVVSRSRAIRSRNQACERWSEVAGVKSVTSEPVPAWVKDRYL